MQSYWKLLLELTKSTELILILQTENICVKLV